MIRRDTVALLQPLIDSGETDIAADFAHRIPGLCVCGVLRTPARELAMTIREVTKIYVAAIMDVDDGW